MTWSKSASVTLMRLSSMKSTRSSPYGAVEFKVQRIRCRRAGADYHLPRLDNQASRPPAGRREVKCGMGDGEDEPARWPQHLMQLPQRGFQSTHVLEDHVRDDEIECPGPERGEVGEVGLNESDPERGPSLVRVRHRQE